MELTDSEKLYVDRLAKRGPRFVSHRTRVLVCGLFCLFGAACLTNAVIRALDLRALASQNGLLIQHGFLPAEVGDDPVALLVFEVESAVRSALLCALAGVSLLLMACYEWRDKKNIELLLKIHGAWPDASSAEGEEGRE